MSHLLSLPMDQSPRLSGCQPRLGPTSVRNPKRLTSLDALIFYQLMLMLLSHSQSSTQILGPLKRSDDGISEQNASVRRRVSESGKRVEGAGERLTGPLPGMTPAPQISRPWGRPGPGLSVEIPSPWEVEEGKRVGISQKSQNPNSDHRAF